MPAWLAPSQDGSAVPLWASMLMLVMGLALTGFVAYFLARAKVAAAARAATAPGRPASLAPKTAAGPAVPAANPEIARELDELCKRVADELDQRAERLEKLIAEADTKLARLERLTAGTVAAIPDPLAVLTEPKRLATPVPIHDGDPLAGEVYRLSDSGLPPIQIAQKLGQHTGKVELILALRRA